MNQGQRSVLSRIFEKDAPPSGAMVLVVAALRPPPAAAGAPALVRFRPPGSAGNLCEQPARQGRLSLARGHTASSGRRHGR